MFKRYKAYIASSGQGDNWEKIAVCPTLAAANEYCNTNDCWVWIVEFSFKRQLENMIEDDLTDVEAELYAIN